MEETYDIKKAIIYLVILIIIIGVFYGITVLVTNNKKEEKTVNTDPYVSIQYESILVSNILKQNNDDYYVLATTKNDNNYKQLISDFSTYTTKQGALPSYNIDLDNSFNKKYLQENSDFEKEIPTFKTSTLLRITNHAITEIYEDEKVSEAILKLVNG